MIQSQQGLHQDSIPVMLMYYSFKSNRQDAKGAVWSYYSGNKGLTFWERGASDDAF